ncbi:MAG: winged helix DNA-binding domain-containing protein [bacterium]|nr:winged helix DNA-binding domain-containing protein [bacterium]
MNQRRQAQEGFMSRIRIDAEERRRRLGVRHHLHPDHKAVSVPEAAGHQVGLHSSDPATVFLSAWARVADSTVAGIESCLYGPRPSLHRVLGMRRTLFAVPSDLVPFLHHGCARRLAPAERKRLIGYLRKQDIAAQAEQWLDRVADATVAAIAEQGEAAAVELRDRVPELRLTLTFGEGKKWGGRVGVSTRVLFLLATEGRIVRGRPRGSWISGQYRWSVTEDRIPGGIPHLDGVTARSRLLGRWLTTYGPGTEADLRWWTGWPLRDVRKALGSLETTEVEVDTGPAFMLSQDLAATPPQEPWANLLPSLDSTVMGWRDRGWYLGTHSRQLFDRNGNAGPTVWWNGRVVGGWAHTAGGTVAYRLLEDIGSEGEVLVGELASELEEWIGHTRVTPRFRTPLDKELVAGG